MPGFSFVAQETCLLSTIYIYIFLVQKGIIYSTGEGITVCAGKKGQALELDDPGSDTGSSRRLLISGPGIRPFFPL